MNVIEEKIKIKISEIQIKREEIKELQEQLFKEEFFCVSKEYLKEWLMENGKDRYVDNPVVSNGYGDYTFVRIKDGELEIGGYMYNDRYRGEDTIFLQCDYKSYRDYSITYLPK